MPCRPAITLPLPDARRAARVDGWTLNAYVTSRIITDLSVNRTMTALAVQTLAGVPETYDVATRNRSYTFTA